MDNDDRQVGRILSRREVLSLLGATTAVLLVGCGPGDEATGAATATSGASGAATQAPGASATPALPATETAVVPVTEAAALPATETAALPACVVRPELTEGPFFLDEVLNRADIRSDPATGAVSDGLPLALAFQVSQIDAQGCRPLSGAQVDVWHCDAAGTYSGVNDGRTNTVGQSFLRGYQVTDQNGVANFLTIYPGWYQGRAVHIHFKIRATAVDGRNYEFTSQLFFDENVTDEVYAQGAYAGRGQRTVLNEQDGIYRSGGSQLLLALNQAEQGYATLFDVGLQMS
jgi:protocatechuate 3,4-dioxygenase beta subunit